MKIRRVIALTALGATAGFVYGVYVCGVDVQLTVSSGFGGIKLTDLTRPA